MIYYDLEVLLPPLRGRVQAPTKERVPDPSEPYTIKVNQHIPCGWTVQSKFAYGEVVHPEKSYRGKNCIKNLC